jgi:hypothetical protein
MRFGLVTPSAPETRRARTGDGALNYRLQLIRGGETGSRLRPASVCSSPQVRREGPRCRGRGAAGEPAGERGARSAARHALERGAHVGALGKGPLRRRCVDDRAQPRAERRLAGAPALQPAGGDDVALRAVGGGPGCDGVEREPLREPGHSLGLQLRRRAGRCGASRRRRGFGGRWRAGISGRRESRSRTGAAAGQNRPFPGGCPPTPGQIRPFRGRCPPTPRGRIRSRLGRRARVRCEAYREEVVQLIRRGVEVLFA